jgi:hypothetical protein
MKLAGDRLDPSETYDSPWFGGGTDRPAIRDEKGGQRVVGIQGSCGEELNSLGLISIRRPLAASASTREDNFLRVTDLPWQRGRVGGNHLKVNHTAGEFWPWLTRDFRFCDEFLYAHAPSEAVYPIPPGANSFTAVGYCAASGRVTYRLLADGVQIYESDSTQINHVVPVRVDLPARARELTLQVDAREDNHWDHSYWLRPRFHTLPVARVEGPGDESGHVKLTELDPDSTRVVQGEFHVNEPNRHRPVDLAEIRPCDEFITTHAPSLVTYPIPDGVKEFSAIGYCVRSATVKFCVFADGRLLHESPLAGIVPIRVPLPRGTRSLELVVKPFDHRFYDMSNWCYPRLHW